GAETGVDERGRVFEQRCGVLVLQRRQPRRRRCRVDVVLHAAAITRTVVDLVGGVVLTAVEVVIGPEVDEYAGAWVGLYLGRRQCGRTVQSLGVDVPRCHLTLARIEPEVDRV